MTELFPVTKEEMIAELKRELETRLRVYPRQIEAKLLKPQTAARRIEVLEKVILLVENS